MTDYEILIKARKLLGPNGENWIQGSLISNEGFYSLGAIVSAGEQEISNNQYKSIINCFNIPRLADFNDTHSWPEVAKLWDEAIEKASKNVE